MPTTRLPPPAARGALGRGALGLERAEEGLLGPEDLHRGRRVLGEAEHLRFCALGFPGLSRVCRMCGNAVEPLRYSKVFGAVWRVFEVLASLPSRTL